MSFLIFTEQAGDKLKLVADIDEVEDAAEAVDALVDADGKFGGQEFIVFDSEARFEVQAGEPIKRSSVKGSAPKRTRRANPSGNGRRTASKAKAAPKATPKTAATKRTSRKATTAAKKAAPKKPAAAKTTPKKPAVKAGGKSTPKKPAIKTGAKKGGGFKRSSKGDD